MASGARTVRGGTLWKIDCPVGRSCRYFGPVFFRSFAKSSPSRKATTVRPEIFSKEL
jgi:hypothetical protein